MMPIVKKYKKLEDCIDGSMIYEFVLYRSTDIDFINFLKTKGDIDYYPDFPKPLFRGEIRGVSHITGCLGTDRFRVVLYRNDPKRNLILLNQVLEDFRPAQ